MSIYVLAYNLTRVITSGSPFTLEGSEGRKAPQRNDFVPTARQSTLGRWPVCESQRAVDTSKSLVGTRRAEDTGDTSQLPQHITEEGDVIGIDACNGNSTAWKRDRQVGDITFLSTG